MKLLFALQLLLTISTTMAAENCSDATGTLIKNQYGKIFAMNARKELIEIKNFEVEEIEVTELNEEHFVNKELKREYYLLNSLKRVSIKKKDGSNFNDSFYVRSQQGKSLDAFIVCESITIYSTDVP